MNRHERRAQAALERKVEKSTEALPDAKVLIAIPSQSMWYGAFAMCVIQMILDSYAYATPGFGQLEIAIENIRGSMLWKQRSNLVANGLKRGCTHLLFIDSDQTFPANTLRRLLHHKKPVVAANVAVKRLPSLPTARERLDDGRARPIFTTPESSGLQQVWRIGTGIMMLDLSIMAKVEQPWFKVEWGDESSQYGEDWWFCSQIEKAGFPIYIDHDVSWDVGHIGDFVFRHDMIGPAIIEETERIFAEGTAEEQQSPGDALEARLGGM